jgi:trans-2,3-dihydro-3-hydroxyanthranilate isomerase
MRRFRYVLADVFTDTPLQGNQLAVFTDARDLTSEEMQAIARETNLSETVFCLPPGAPGADVRIRRESCRLPAIRRSAQRSCSPGPCRGS